MGERSYRSQEDTLREGKGLFLTKTKKRHLGHDIMLLSICVIWLVQLVSLPQFRHNVFQGTFLLCFVLSAFSRRVRRLEREKGEKGEKGGGRKKSH